MAQHISPFLRSPFTDLTGGLVSHQLMGRCATMEMDLMDCLEAYGLDRGMRKCKDLLEEFRECHMLTKQFKRFNGNILLRTIWWDGSRGKIQDPSGTRLDKFATLECSYRACASSEISLIEFNLIWAMRVEREKQIAEGRLKGECRYVTPKVDSF